MTKERKSYLDIRPPRLRFGVDFGVGFDLTIFWGVAVFCGEDFGVVEALTLATAKCALVPLADLAKERMRTRRSEMARGVGISRFEAGREFSLSF